MLDELGIQVNISRVLFLVHHLEDESLYEPFLDLRADVFPFFAQPEL